jgi:hypothetical protein
MGPLKHKHMELHGESLNAKVSFLQSSNSLMLIPALARYVPSDKQQGHSYNHQKTMQLRVVDRIFGKLFKL